MKNNNQINVPQAREAMDRFKMHHTNYGIYPPQPYCSGPYPNRAIHSSHYPISNARQDACRA